MATYRPEEVLSGSWGYVYIDGEHWADVKKIDAKIVQNTTDVILPGGQKGKKPTSVAGEGSFTFDKIYSREHSNFLDTVKNNQQATFMIEFETDDPDSKGAESIRINNVNLDGDFPLFSSERENLQEREISFVFLPMDIEIDELISD
jgi:hypothetical protein